jgi:hypothetical protein
MLKSVIYKKSKSDQTKSSVRCCQSCLEAPGLPTKRTTSSLAASGMPVSCSQTRAFGSPTNTMASPPANSHHMEKRYRALYKIYRTASTLVFVSQYCISPPRLIRVSVRKIGRLGRCHFLNVLSCPASHLLK